MLKCGGSNIVVVVFLHNICDVGKPALIAHCWNRETDRQKDGRVNGQMGGWAGTRI